MKVCIVYLGELGGEYDQDILKFSKKKNKVCYFKDGDGNFIPILILKVSKLDHWSK